MLSSSLINRAMVVKIMCFSIMWYHAGVMPGWTNTLERIDKRVNRFLWKDSIPKVAKSTLIRDKKHGGLNVWNLNAKAAAFRNVWIVKYLTGKLNPILTATINAISEWYRQVAKMQMGLWETRTDHSSFIRKAIHLPF